MSSPCARSGASPLRRSSSRRLCSWSRSYSALCVAFIFASLAASATLASCCSCHLANFFEMIAFTSASVYLACRWAPPPCWFAPCCAPAWACRWVSSPLAWACWPSYPAISHTPCPRMSRPCGSAFVTVPLSSSRLGRAGGPPSRATPTRKAPRCARSPPPWGGHGSAGAPRRRHPP